MRRADLKDVEKETFEWNRRFSVLLRGLPPELRKINPVASAAVRSNVQQNWLREFLVLASSAKQTRAKNLLLQDSDQLASTVTCLTVGKSVLLSGHRQLLSVGSY